MLLKEKNNSKIIEMDYCNHKLKIQNNNYKKQDNLFMNN